MTGFWLDDPQFPTDLGDLLLVGAVGRDHLLRAAALAAAAAKTAAAKDRPTWLRRQTSLLAAALEEDPLYGPTAKALITQLPALPPGSLNPNFVGLAAALAARFAVPENTAYFERLTASGNDARLTSYLENEIRTGRHALFWLHVALRRAVLARDFDRAETLAGCVLTNELAPLGAKVAGDLALLAGRRTVALTRYQSVQAVAPWPGGLFRLGLAAAALGDVALARNHLSALVRAMPEHVSALLSLADLVSGRANAVSRLPGSLAIALYTYNKAADLDRTLASLFASDQSTCAGSPRVFVLDNASGDATPEVVAAWAKRFDQERLVSIRLAVNVGAPAARNWLAADARLQQADFVAYLDDDVDLPSDWLARLAAAVEAYPEAGVWGCHVADAQNPAIAQGVDGMLTAPQNGGDGLHLGDLHAQGFDFGGFAHLRPCLTVMGCCHLFRRDRLLRAGGFDIRYSPSQYDDVDHDLRLVLAGAPPVYQGHLTVAHRRPAPALVPQQPQQLAGARANWQKLAAKHADQLAELVQRQRATAANDLRQKWLEIAEIERVEKKP